MGCVPAHQPAQSTATSTSEDPDGDDARAGRPLSESEHSTADPSTAADVGGGLWCMSSDLAGMRARLRAIAEERRRLDLEQCSLERRVALAEAASAALAEAAAREVRLTPAFVTCLAARLISN